MTTAEIVATLDPTAGAAERSTVKPALTATLTAAKRSRYVDNDEYAAFVQRIIRAHSRRVAAGDVDALAALVALSGELDQAISDAVGGLRAWGYSWTEIAARLGITRQGAQQRWTERS